MYVNHNPSRNQGFTLLEMMVSIIIVGLLVGMAATAYSSHIKAQQISHTADVMEKVNTALQIFKDANGRYPCPAPLLEPRDSAKYGNEVQCDMDPGTPGQDAMPGGLLPVLDNASCVSGFRNGHVCTVGAGMNPEFYNNFSALGLSTTNSPDWMGSVDDYPEDCYDAGTYYVCDKNTLILVRIFYNANPPPGQDAVPGIPPDPALDIDPGHCINPSSFAGVCVEQGPRTDLTDAQRRVRLGGIPFRQLQLDEKDTIDGYGNRLVYAVTETLANEKTYAEKGGAIQIVDFAGAMLSDGERSSAYVVISPGKNRNGGVSANGVAVPCTGTGLDTQNCRDFTDVTNAASVYAMDLNSIGFDDAVSYFIPNAPATWRRVDKTSENVTDLSEGRVAIGIDDVSEITDALNVGQTTVHYSSTPSQYSVLAPVNTNATAHQTGSIRVGQKNSGNANLNVNSKVFAKEYCDRAGTKCFDVEDVIDMGTNVCPSGEYMVGIKDGAPLCSAVRFHCPSPKVFTGFDATNRPICVEPEDSCEEKTDAEICGDTRTLSPTPSGTPYPLTYTVNGACANKTYLCDAGNWKLMTLADGPAYDPANYSAARCSFNAAMPPSGTDTGQSCGDGYGGSYDQNWVEDCAGNKVFTSRSNDTCSCTGDKKVENYTCPANFGGAVVATQELTKGCSGNVLDANWTPGPWKDLNGVPVTDPFTLCTCSKTPSWEFDTCPLTKIRKDSPSPASFADPVASWPANPRMGGYRRVDVDATTCVLTRGTYDYSNCQCNMDETRFVERDPVCTSCEDIATKSLIRQVHADETCGWVDDVDTSGNTAGTCKPKRFSWISDNNVTATAPIGDDNGGAVEPNSSCSCANSGKETSCAVLTPTKWVFYTCRCTYQP
jgi:prepilin-type N-terminal cleavage/methylation domain-containing protein